LVDDDLCGLDRNVETGRDFGCSRNVAFPAIDRDVCGRDSQSFPPPTQSQGPDSKKTTERYDLSDVGLLGGGVQAELSGHGDQELFHDFRPETAEATSCENNEDFVCVRVTNHVRPRVETTDMRVMDGGCR
jgi:hypothetical protein